MSEENLWLARARAGDPQAFTRLVEAYQTPIYNLCYRMLGEAGEAEDAAQETFLRAYTRLSRYDPQRSFKTWLFSIASHHCIDRLRKRRFAWLSLDEPPPAHPALRDREPEPETAVVQREREAQISRLMAKLQPDEAREEARRSKQLIETHLGKAVTSFAYAYGMRADESPATARILADCGYRSVFISQHGTIRRGADPLRLPRIKVEAGEPLWMFKLLCRGGMDAWSLADRLL